MNSSELDISHIIGSDNFVPFDLSNNAATLGDNARELTWAASKEAAQEITLLDCEEKKESFRDFVLSSGGWNAEEVAAMSDETLSALLLQWIAGDIREAFGDAEPSEWDWEEYRKNSEAGQVSSRLHKGDDGKVYFSISN